MADSAEHKTNGSAKRKVVAMIHTSSTLEPVFERIRREKELDFDIVHIIDDSMISDVIAQGNLSAETSDRVCRHIAAAEQAAADYIMVTCSSIGTAVDQAQAGIRVPVMRVDQPMADRAVLLGRRIGVLATLRTTLDPTCELIRRRAQAIGKEIEIEAQVCDGAFDAFRQGRLADHDQAVVAALRSLAQRVDVVVLAQASMARVAESMPVGELKVPVLSSPTLAMEHLASIM
ncbi:MAG: hypothetical protein KF688_15285 [Pirellulales bacterium]|mgnify:CR=1 FL=1|nr:hypothetical protein [Pirellulales bacterium]